METFDIHEVEENRAKLRAGRGIVRIESSMTDEHIGKLIRLKLEQACGADITVTYDLITDEMQRAAQDL
ncbi:hypothetical protein [Klebsiella pneumoniae]|uniref:hypothetical protein n=1 Tax=Klebsiella pneumoniae TaxID=573 RepID=UPI0009BAF02F|nr:hypothetical protein [Klebsiella pneumoniae]SLS86955.1 Uncharacterised protein [Klebsiella pneumoniae]SLS91375.1 Uncharacterised protein [Klebsiella pneumoniae]SLS96199.1 Uncharacterised protein [Klebsiella pneumoniae]SLS97898.1 Uncharacterised protein [Klebsiella pneumoniae]SLT04016.1 Uncharacterised protein [Klebsiella pneumoniae]